MPMDVADFDFQLPDELVAQHPSPTRGGSRLLVVNRATHELTFTAFAQLGDHLRPGDLLVVNNTSVFPARLLGRREPSGGAVECLLLTKLDASQLEAGNQTLGVGIGDLGVGNWELGVEYWQALMHPGQKLKPGARVVFAAPGAVLHGEVLGQHFHGRRTIRLWADDGLEVAAAIDRLGHIPLPPYIKRDDTTADRERYQTVYAQSRGSVAAPTAGLHFTAEQLASLRRQGIERADVTLHVGYGTFKPVRAARVEEHEVDAERYEVSADTAAALTRARREGRRIIAVGTTTVRVLESLAFEGGVVLPSSGETRLFIHPGHRFALVDGLVTNFHLPRSSLLMLVAAFAGRELVLRAYAEAVAGRYHFYSYGDAMLVV
jgi:S-adenosylmethionine:tRNA ribosyltransferase-isomerase